MLIHSLSQVEVVLSCKVASLNGELRDFDNSVVGGRARTVNGERKPK